MGVSFRALLCVAMIRLVSSEESCAALDLPDEVDSDSSLLQHSTSPMQVVVVHPNQRRLSQITRQTASSNTQRHSDSIGAPNLLLNVQGSGNVHATVGNTLDGRAVRTTLLVSAVIVAIVLIVSTLSAVHGGTCFPSVGFQTLEEVPDSTSLTPVAEKATEPGRSRLMRDCGVTCAANYFANGAVSQSIPNVLNATPVHDDRHDRVNGDSFLDRWIPNGSLAAGAVKTNELDKLRDLSIKNLVLMIMCLICVAVNVVCMSINCMGADAREYYERSFHLLEFWDAYVFSCVQLYSLVVSPRDLASVHRSPSSLIAVGVVNALIALTSALLISISMESFEAIAHEIEYAGEVTMAFLDVALLCIVTKHVGLVLETTDITSVSAVVTLLIAVIQFGGYNWWDGPKGGPGERMSHFFEFGFGTISALICFSFCLDNKMWCDSKVEQQVPCHHEEPMNVGAVDGLDG